MSKSDSESPAVIIVGNPTDAVGTLLAPFVERCRLAFGDVSTCAALLFLATEIHVQHGGFKEELIFAVSKAHDSVKEIHDKNASNVSRETTKGN